MIEFEEEFNNCLHFGFIPNEPQNKIIEHFKDWQPPKPLVVVPQIVASYIETEKYNDFDRVGTLVYGHYKAAVGDKEYYEFNEWIACNFDTFLEAIVNGYTVEKEKMFYLKHIDMSETDEHYDYYLSKSPKGNIFHSNIGKGKLPKLKCILKLTQQEIESLHAGSYEQIEVEP